MTAGLCRVVVLDGMPTSGEEEVTDSLLQALDEAGLGVKVLRLRDLEIAACQGCFECWIRTPGKCVLPDAGRDVAKTIIRSDLTVFLTPVTFGGYSSELKKAVDRLIPLVSPYFRRVGGEVHHRPRYRRYPRLLGVGLLDHCGFPEAPQHETALAICRKFAAAMGWEWAGGIAMGGTGVPSSLRASSPLSLRPRGEDRIPAVGYRLTAEDAENAENSRSTETPTTKDTKRNNSHELWGWEPPVPLRSSCPPSCPWWCNSGFLCDLGGKQAMHSAVRTELQRESARRRPACHGSAAPGVPTRAASASLQKVVALAAEALSRGDPVPEEAAALAAKPAMRTWLYILGGNLMWRWEARRNGVKVSLRARPYDPKKG